MSMEKGSWDYSTLWQETLKQMRTDFSEQEYVMWFKNLTYNRSDEDHITLAVPSSFYRDQIIQRYQSNIEDKLLELQGTPLKVKFIIET